MFSFQKKEKKIFFFSQIWNDIHFLHFWISNLATSHTTQLLTEGPLHMANAKSRGKHQPRAASRKKPFCNSKGNHCIPGEIEWNDMESMEILFVRCVVGMTMTISFSFFFVFVFGLTRNRGDMCVQKLFILLKCVQHVLALTLPLSLSLLL